MYVTDTCDIKDDLYRQVLTVCLIKLHAASTLIHCTALTANNKSN